MFFRHEKLNFRFCFQIIVNENWIVELFFSFSWFEKYNSKSELDSTMFLNNRLNVKFETVHFYTKIFHVWCFFIWKNKFRVDFVFDNCFKQQSFDFEKISILPFSSWFRSVRFRALYAEIWNRWELFFRIESKNYFS